MLTKLAFLVVVTISLFSMSTFSFITKTRFTQISSRFFVASKNFVQPLSNSKRQGKFTTDRKNDIKYTALLTSLNPADNEPAVSKLKKRKVALVCSYLGTEYYGLQMDVNAGHLNTIELQLKDALTKIKCISELNSRHLRQIQWSRSSRTDKGVHAARIVISAKLELQPEWLMQNAVDGEDNDTNYNIKEIPELCNELLPEDIRVLSCTKINRSFLAKDSCSWREYEYLLPVSLLTTPNDQPTTNPVNHDQDSNTDNIDNDCTQFFRGPTCSDPSDINAIVKALNKSLQKMEGSHSYHNFHRLSRKTIRKYSNDPSKKGGKGNRDSRGGGGRRGGGQEEDDDEEVEEEEVLEEDLPQGKARPNSVPFSYKSTTGTATEVDMLSLQRPGRPPSINSYNSTSTPGTTPANMKSFYESWMPENKETSPKVRGTIYRCTASVYVPADGTEGAPPMIRIKIRGQGFLLHQIRIIVGTAVLVARGQLPELIVDLALGIPLQFNLPMAPAEGLVLVDAGFDRNGNRQPIAVTPNSRGHPFDLVLMEPEEYDRSLDFEEMFIKKQIREDWARDNQVLVTTWLKATERFTVPLAVFQQWDSLAVENAQVMREQVEERDQKERGRVRKFVAYFQAQLCRKTPTTQNSVNSRRSSNSNSGDSSGSDSSYGNSNNKSQGSGRSDRDRQNAQDERDSSRDKGDSTESKDSGDSSRDGRQGVDNDAERSQAEADFVNRLERNDFSITPKLQRDPGSSLPEAFAHKQFLPNSFATELVRRFDVVPGGEVSNALNAIASQIAVGNMPYHLSAAQLLDAVIQVGIRTLGRAPTSNEEMSRKKDPSKDRDSIYRLHQYDEKDHMDVTGRFEPDDNVCSDGDVIKAMIDVDTVNSNPQALYEVFRMWAHSMPMHMCIR
jgi:tRNA pseudouridine(38-40) synthase